MTRRFGHRGRNATWHKIRKLLFTGSEDLDERGSDYIVLAPLVGDAHDELLMRRARQLCGPQGRLKREILRGGVGYERPGA